MMSVACYISGHGFGHAVRASQVIRSLREARPELEFYVRTTAPQWLFEERPFRVTYERRALDVGISQKDSLLIDIEETLRACEVLHERIPRLIEEELTFIKRQGIRLILGDIPPPCFEIAAAASLPSVAIGNFTWNWIYRAYLPDFPSFLPLIEEMEGFYRKATLALSLPFSCDLRIFPNQQPIPLIARVSPMNKLEARKKFGLPAAAKVVLLSFGGFELKRFPWETLERLGDFFFAATGHVSKKNLLALPDALPHYEDLVRGADIVVSKPGYGIVSDVIAHQVPILYTSRGDFPEYPFLVNVLNQWATCDFIPQEELLAGHLGPYLKRILDKGQNWPAIPINGAQVAAERILEFL